jgi:hypothetical protein
MRGKTRAYSCRIGSESRGGEGGECCSLWIISWFHSRYNIILNDIFLSFWSIDDRIHIKLNWIESFVKITNHWQPDVSYGISSKLLEHILSLRLLIVIGKHRLSNLVLFYSHVIKTS